MYNCFVKIFFWEYFINNVIYNDIYVYSIFAYVINY